jgi:hypothetical protein
MRNIPSCYNSLRPDREAREVPFIHSRKERTALLRSWNSSKNSREQVQVEDGPV